MPESEYWVRCRLFAHNFFQLLRSFCFEHADHIHLSIACTFDMCGIQIRINSINLEGEMKRISICDIFGSHHIDNVSHFISISLYLECKLQTHRHSHHGNDFNCIHYFLVFEFGRCRFEMLKNYLHCSYQKSLTFQQPMDARRQMYKLNSSVIWMKE